MIKILIMLFKLIIALILMIFTPIIMAIFILVGACVYENYGVVGNSLQSLEKNYIKNKIIFNELEKALEENYSESREKKIKELTKKIGCKEVDYNTRELSQILFRASNTGFFFTSGSAHGYLYSPRVKPENIYDYRREKSWNRDDYTHLSGPWYTYMHTRED